MLKVLTVANNLPTSGKFILNFSQAFGFRHRANFLDPVPCDLTGLQVFPGPLERAVAARMWKEETRNLTPDFLAVTAAGNEARDDCTAVYEGFQLAAYRSLI